MRAELTRYSDKIAGTTRNFDQAVRFDMTDGQFLGITQYDDEDSVRDRVLLSPAQIKEMIAFISHKPERAPDND